MRVIFFFLLQLFRIGLMAQMQHQPVSGVYSGPAAYSVQHADIFSGSSNPASIIHAETTAVGIYGGSSYGLKELHSVQMQALQKAGRFYTGFSAAYSGFPVYHESLVSVIVARKAGDHAEIGLSFSYCAVHQSGYRNYTRPGAGIGIRLHPVPGLTVGFRAENPGEHLLPSVYSWGIGYDVSRSFFAGLEMIREEHMPARIQAAVEYTVHPLLFRFGLNSASFSFFMGAGYRKGSWMLMVMASRHPLLGFSNGILFQFTRPGHEK